LSLLKSLNTKSYTAGLLEAIRVGIISDETLFAFIEQNLTGLFRQDVKALLFLVHKVCALKSELNSRNQLSQGTPRVLNFGKTVERILLNSTREWNINPIEAQFLGILIESILANRYDYLNQEDYQRIETILFKLGLDISIDKIDFDKLHGFIQEANDCPEHFTFPKRIGESVFIKRKAI
jgi:3-dehydroquinate synthase